MTSSQGKGCCRDDTANGRRPWWGRLLLAIGIVALLALAVLAFVGYRQPELLLDYVNLRYCG